MFSVCVGVMGEVWFSFFSYVSFHASVLYTCFSMEVIKLLLGQSWMVVPLSVILLHPEASSHYNLYFWGHLAEHCFL